MIAASIGLFFSGCAAQNALEPLGEGETQVRATAGGPIVAAFGTRVPIPYAVAGIERGLTDRINLTADLHALPLFYQMAGGEVGVKWFPASLGRPHLTVGWGGRMLALASFRPRVHHRIRIYPILNVSALRKWSRRSLYAGADATLPISQSDYDDEAARMILSPFLGVRWELGKDYRLATELKWQGANIRSDQLAVEYTRLGGYGAVATLLSLERIW